MCSAKDRYTLIEQSYNYRINCMQYNIKNFMRIIGNDQKNNGQNFEHNRRRHNRNGVHFIWTSGE